jgi:hydroxymethylpyrimidine/phosphomethylpyrimidine kinase
MNRGRAAHMPKQGNSSPVVLTIGAFDPRGQGGVTVDRSVLLSLDIEPLTLISGIFLDGGEPTSVGRAALEEQLRGFAASGRIAGVKTGGLATRENIETTATFFEDHRSAAGRFVVDVSLEMPDGSPLISHSAISLLKMRLLPLAGLVIAYVSEARTLAALPAIETIDDLKEAAQAIKMYGPSAVLIKGDIAVENQFVDIFLDGADPQLFFSTTIDPSLRRRRDEFSSAVIAGLVRGQSPQRSVKSAGEFVSKSPIQAKGA